METVTIGPYTLKLDIDGILYVLNADGEWEKLKTDF